jgi:hypothetical protein
VKALLTVLTALLLGVCACGSVARPGAAASASPPLSPPDLQYRLVDEVGTPLYCNPSQGPIVSSEDPTLTAHMVAALRAQNPTEFDAIVRHENLNAASLSQADDQRVLSQAGMLSAVQLQPQGSAYRFALVVAASPPVEVTGTITATGDISVAKRTPAAPHLCPL